MQKILIDEIRIDGFRGLKDFKMSLSETTVLTGMNNVGKTTVLKALQLLFGNSSFLSTEDLHIERDNKSNCIIVDARIIAIGSDGQRVVNFSDVWEMAFGVDSIKMDSEERAYVPLRAKYTYQSLQNSFNRDIQILNEWESVGIEWQDLKGKKSTIKGEYIQFYYLDAKRDILEDVKLRTSYLGKMLGDVVSNYDPQDIADLEQKISSLNAEAIEKSDVLKNIQESLKGIDTTMDSSGKVSVSPFAKKLRDLNKSLTIHYGSEDNSFTMDYHGMGTRSWSSMLSFRAFIRQMCDSKNPEDEAFLPIIAIEEPEAHLHPNAQKQLYKQMNEMPGIKIISTHSPYVAACAELSELRGMYKADDKTVCGSLPVAKLTSEDQRKIRQAVLTSNGELLFAKAIVLGEGETEVQALPIFCQRYWNLTNVELGLSFVDAKGCGNYYPFVALANAFHIPWYIFSDGEKRTTKGLEKLLKTAYNEARELKEQSNIFIIPNEQDFEGMLLDDGYKNEVETAIKLLKGEDYIEKYIRDKNHTVKEREKTPDVCESCHQNIFRDIERIYDGEDGRLTALDDIMEKNKAQLGPILANCIIESDKPLPSLIVKLFDEIKNDISHV
jgi:putative ATP-dependent endonuclease of OLD family